MTALEQLLIRIIGAVAFLLFAWLGVQHFGAARYAAGFAAAVAAGKERFDFEAELNRQLESDLRAQLRAKDADALTKEQIHVENLAAAQRRMRIGADSLRCPAGPHQVATAPGNRSVASGPDPDPEGSPFVPEVAAEILGDGADIARIVRQYDRIVDRFEACRAMNAGH